MYTPLEIRRIVKRDAREALKGHWLPTLAVFLLYYVPAGLFAYWLFARGQALRPMGLFLFFVQLLVLAPLFMGIRWWSLQLVRKRKVQFGDVFRFYQKLRYIPALFTVGFFKVIEYILSLVCIYMVVVCTMILSCYMGIFWSFDQLFSLFDVQYYSLGFMMSHGDLVMLIFTLTMCVAMVVIIKFAVQVFLARYLCAYNLIIDGVVETLPEALSGSRSIMRGQTIDMMLFYLSLMGWMFLSLITAGLALIYFIPYFYCAETLYLEYFRDHYEHNCDTMGYRFY